MRAKDNLNKNMMRLSEQLLQLISIFKEASKNFILIFLYNYKQAKKFKNHLRMSRKYLFNFIGLIYSTGDIISLKEPKKFPAGSIP